MQEKLDAERSKRKLADLTDALRQQREIDAQIERTRAAHANSTATLRGEEDSAEQRESRLQLDKRAQDGEVLQLTFGKPEEGSEPGNGAVATGDASAGPSSGTPRTRPFEDLGGGSNTAGEGGGTAADTNGGFQGPVKKKSKVWRAVRKTCTFSQRLLFS